MKTCTYLAAVLSAATASAVEPINTSAPYTLPPGGVQVEGSVFAFYADKNNTAKDSSRSEYWSVAPFTLRVGLPASLELQLGFEPLLIQEYKDRTTATTDRQHGVGDTTLGVKLNLRGNDNDEVAAWGVLAHVKLPTADDAFGNGNLEGGLTLLLSTYIGESVSVD